MNTIQKQLRLIAAMLTMLVLMLSTAAADPLPGRDVLKFSQRPMDGTTIMNPQGVPERYWGHDEVSTAYGSGPGPGGVPLVYQGRFMADDFADKFSSPVVHVKWWGSYLNNIVTPNTPVDKFLISFERDVPAGPDNPFSRPGEPLLNQIVRRVPIGGLTPGSGTFTEEPLSGGGPPLNERLYEYNAELHLGKEFRQEPDTVYWLKIVALVDATFPVDPNEPIPDFLPQWGWHNRDYTIRNSLASMAPAVVPGEHLDDIINPSPIPELGTRVWHFQDDAVTGRIAVNVSGPMGQVMPVIDQSEYRPTRYLGLADGPPVVAEFSKDLAFELYTIVPEPAACGLMIVALVGAAVTYRRRLG